MHNDNAQDTNLDNEKKLLSKIGREIKVPDSVMHSLQKSAEAFSITVNSLQWIRETIEKMEKRRKDEKSSFLGSGWWIAPSFMNLPESRINKTVDEYHLGNQDAITELMLSVYQSDRSAYLQETVKSWIKKNKFFAPWERHLLDALSAHKQGKYTLSIPTLLLITEGISTNYCKAKGLYDHADKSKTKQKYIKAVREYYVRINHLFLGDLDLLENALDERIFKTTDYLEGKGGVLNRHEVIHGTNENYDTLLGSLQCFLLLDVFSELE